MPARTREIFQLNKYTVLIFLKNCSYLFIYYYLSREITNNSVLHCVNHKRTNVITFFHKVYLHGLVVVNIVEVMIVWTDKRSLMEYCRDALLVTSRLDSKTAWRNVKKTRVLFDLTKTEYLCQFFFYRLSPQCRANLCSKLMQ